MGNQGKMGFWESSRGEVVGGDFGESCFWLIRYLVVISAPTN